MTEARTDALATLRAAGYGVGEVLGAGMEGTVAALDDDRVVKLWDRRTRDDVDRLRTFYDAVHAAGFALAVPRILEVTEVEGRVVTVQARLYGAAPAAADATLVVQVLDDLAAVPVHPDMAVLPVPDGETAFDPAVPFPLSMADLVERRGRILSGHVEPAAVAALVADLGGLAPAPPALVHGDLGIGNLLVADGRPSGLLDFGYVSTIGDPAFDAAVAAALHRMLGADDAAGTHELDALTSARFGYDHHRLATYRAAYGLVTASCLVAYPQGEHFRWCLDLVTSRS